MATIRTAEPVAEAIEVFAKTRSPEQRMRLAHRILWEYARRQKDGGEVPWGRPLKDEAFLEYRGKKGETTVRSISEAPFTILAQFRIPLKFSEKDLFEVIGGLMRVDKLGVRFPDSKEKGVILILDPESDEELKDVVPGFRVGIPPTAKNTDEGEEAEPHATRRTRTTHHHEPTEGRRAVPRTTEDARAFLTRNYTDKKMPLPSNPISVLILDARWGRPDAERIVQELNERGFFGDVVINIPNSSRDEDDDNERHTRKKETPTPRHLQEVVRIPSSDRDTWTCRKCGQALKNWPAGIAAHNRMHERLVTTVTPEEASVVPPPVASPEVYCRYCNERFRTAQQLGGHVNARHSNQLPTTTDALEHLRAMTSGTMEWNGQNLPVLAIKGGLIQFLTHELNIALTMAGRRVKTLKEERQILETKQRDNEGRYIWLIPPDGQQDEKHDPSLRETSDKALPSERPTPQQHAIGLLEEIRSLLEQSSTGSLEEEVGCLDMAVVSSHELTELLKGLKADATSAARTNRKA